MVSSRLDQPDPDKFVRVHGKEHAQNAIEMGQSTIVKCSSCNTKY